MQQGHAVIVGAVDRHVGADTGLPGTNQRGRHRVDSFLSLLEVHSRCAVYEGQILRMLFGCSVEIVSKSHLKSPQSSFLNVVKGVAIVAYLARRREAASSRTVSALR